MTDLFEPGIKVSRDEYTFILEQADIFRATEQNPYPPL